jgi:hypothetical protein
MAMNKKTIQMILLAAVLFVMGCNSTTGSPGADNTAHNPQKPTLKRYELRSGIVQYTVKISGKIMGGKVSGSGTQGLYFKNWGALELREEESTQTTEINVFGNKKKEVVHTHTMDKLDDGISYSVDFDRKIIYKSLDTGMEIVKGFAAGDAHKTGKEMLQAMGGEKTGVESVLGYDCEVWDLPGQGKMWVYKGVPLKILISILGVTHSIQATEAKFDISVPDKYFYLPDFPVKEAPAPEVANFSPDNNGGPGSRQALNQYKDMTYNQYKEMILKEDPDAANMSEEEMKQGYKLFKLMIKQMQK